METKQKLLLIILVFFVISSLLGLVARPSGDGAWHFGIIRFMAENHRLPMFEPLGRMLFTRPPLYHLISAVFYIVFSIVSKDLAEIIVKLLPSIFASLCLFFTFLIVKKLFNKDVAIYATFFLAFLPLYLFVSFRTMPTILGVLLTTIAVYFALEKRIFVSGLFSGLSLLAKEQSGLIIIPILFIISSNYFGEKKVLVKNIFLFLLVTILIASPHYINTFIKVGDPVWPHGALFFDSPYKQEALNMVLPGTKPINIFNILNPEHSIIKPYLEFFGVPHLFDVKSLFLFNIFRIPAINLLLLFWLAGTILYLVPLFIGFWKIKKHNASFNVIAIWFLTFLFMIYCYLFFFGDILVGYLLSGIPALAAIWGFGFFVITKMFARFKKLILLLYILISLGFVMSAAVKIIYTNNSYQFYQEDYDWLNANVPQDKIIYFNDQTLTYNTHRQSITFSNTTELRNGFVMVNQQYNLNSGLAILPQDMVADIEKNPRFVLVYSNNRTSSKVYEIED